MIDAGLERARDRALLIGRRAFGHQPADRAASEGEHRNVEAGAAEFALFHRDSVARNSGLRATRLHCRIRGAAMTDPLTKGKDPLRPRRRPPDRGRYRARAPGRAGDSRQGEVVRCWTTTGCRTRSRSIRDTRRNVQLALICSRATQRGSHITISTSFCARPGQTTARFAQQKRVRVWGLNKKIWSSSCVLAYSPLE